MSETVASETPQSTDTTNTIETPPVVEVVSETSNGKGSKKKVCTIL